MVGTGSAEVVGPVGPSSGLRVQLERTICGCVSTRLC